MFSIIKKYKRNLNNICKIREKGVSLISLIVIIIVLLILAGVTIRISSGDSGLIKKTKKGVAMYQNASEDESGTLNEYARKLKKSVEVPKAETIEFKADITGWTTKDVTVTATSDDPDYEIELKSEDSDWSVRKDNKITVSKNQQINARLKNLVDKNSEDVATYNVTNIDKDAPDKTAPALKATTNSITVTFKQKDDGSGIAKREYSIDSGATWKVGNNVFTFNGLTQGKKYEIITRATDRVENQSISDVSYITTETIPKLVAGSNLTFTPSTSSWTNGNVSVAVSTTVKEYTLQTSTDGKSWGTANPLTYSANGTAYARLWDGNNASAVATTNITNIDKLAPTNTAPTVATTTNKITVTLKQVDQNAGSGSGKSDLNASKTQYRLVTDTNGTTAVTGKDWQSSNVFSGLTQNTTYYVQTKVTDNAGNTTTSEVTTARTTTVPSGTTSGVITLTPDHNTWTNTDVKVTARTNQTGYTIQMSTDGKTFTDGTSKTLTSNGTVYARLRDSSNNYGASVSISISIIDKVAPTLNISKETYQEGFNNWTLPDGGSIDNNILTLTKAGDATSYYYKTGNERWWITLDGYTNKESTKHDGAVGSAGKGNGGINLGSYYFDNAFKSTVSQNSYSGNGWAPQLPINTWSNNFTWSGYEGYGGKIEYVKIYTRTGNEYSQPTVKYRNFKMHGQLYSNFYLINQTNSDDSSKVKVIKYALGNQTVDYFKTAGTVTTDGQIRVTANGTYTVYVQDNAGNDTIKTITIDKIDTTAPTTVAPILSTTTNKITVTSKQTDGESGVLRTQYAIKESGGNYGNWQDSNSFEKLKQGTKYVVKTRATNNAGLSSESGETTVTTGTIPGLTTGSNLTFTPSTSSWTNGNVSVAVSTTVKGYTLQTSTDGKTWGTTNPLTYTANGTAYARLWDGNNASAVATTNITNIDKLAPTNTAPTVATTTNKITVTLKQVDQNAGSGSGKSDLNASKTQYRLVTDTNGTTAVTGKDWQSSNVFSGLTQNTTYYVQTKVTDNAGNTTTSAVATAKTGTIPTPTAGSNLTFTPSTSSWTNGNVSVKVSTTVTGYTLQTSTDGKTWSTTNPLTYSANGTAYARLGDGNNASAVATTNITNIDKLAPTNTAPTVSTTTNRITITNKQVDQNAANGSGKSDLNASKTQYRLVTDTNGTTAVTGKDWQSSNVFSGLTQNTTYYVQTKVTDNAGNTTTSAVATAKTTSVPTPTAGANVTFTPTPSGWTNGNVSVAVSTTVTGYTLQTSTDGKTWGTTNPLIYSANGTAYARLWDGNNASAVATTNITNIDKLAPTNTAPTVATTTNRITATLKQADQNAGSGSGKSDLNGSKTQYRLVTDTNGTTAVTGKDWQSSNVFSGLTQNTTYYVQTKVTDNAGNTTTSAVATAKTAIVPSGTTSGVITLTPDHNTWTNTDVKVTATTNQTGYTIQMSTDGKTFTDGTSKTLTSNGTVYARLRDSSNNYGASATISISIIDKLAPTNTAPTVAATTNKITITNKQVDQNAANGSGKSDLNASKTQYRLVTDTNGTTAVTGKDWQSSNVFSGLTQNTTYYVQTKVTDNAGNTTTSAVATAKTTSVPTPTAGSNLTFTPTPSAWTNGNVSVKVTTTVTGYTLQTSTDGKSWSTTNPLTYSANGTAYARLWDGNNASAVATTNITNIDKLAPTNTAPTVATTTNKITVTLKQVDQNAGSGSGKSDLNASKTQYRLVTDTNGTTAVTGKDWQSSNVFSGLTQNTTYYVQTKVTDNAGNTTTSAVATAKTGTIPTPTTGSNLTFTPSTSSWTNGNVSVAVSTTVKGYTLQTSTDGKSWGTTNPLTYSANGTAYARLWDGNNASAVATTNITNIDKLAPTNTAPTVATTTNKITVTLKQVDQNAGSGSGKSDLNASKTQYRLVTDTNGTTAVTGKDWQSSNVFSGLTQNTTYYVQTKVTDNAGNTTTSAVATVKTTSVPTPTTGSNLTFTPTPSGWTNGNVSVKVATTITGYTLQTSTDGKTWGTTNPLTYSANGTAYARLWDGNNTSAVATTNITNIDKTAPSFNATVSNVSSTGYDVIITGVSDTQSGVNRIQCPTWTESNGQDDIDGSWATSTKSKATKQSDGSYKFRVNITDHKNESGKYITHVYGYDNVGNNMHLILNTTVPAVTITWNANGGTAVNATSGKAGNAIGTLPTTTRTGYTFAGWFTAASGGTQITTTSTYPTTGNVTYYAHWNVNQYAVTCEDWFVDSSNNRKVKLGSASKNVNYGTTVNGSEWGTEASVSKYYSSYVYKSSTSATVGTSGATVYRYFYIWIDVNILNPSGVQDYKSAYFSLSNDGTNWDTNLVNESSKSNNLPYGTVLRIKDLRPYYSYYEYDSYSGCTYSNGQWTYTATAPNSMIIKMKDRTYSLQINPNGGTWNGTSAVSTLNKKYSEVTSISAPTRTGYTFMGFSELLNTQKFNDGRFDSGNNGVGVYNNKNNGQVTVTRQAKSSDNPIGGSYELKVTNAGQQATSPNLGGFVQTLTSEANKKYVHLFIAKLPAGYYFYNRNNSLGNGSSTFWLTSNKGTGNWQVYAYQVNTGSSGTFSTFGHVDASPSATGEWIDRTGSYTAYLAFSNIYDITTNNTGIGQIDGSAVLTANWIANTYKVQFNGNGATSGSMADETFTYNKAQALTTNAFGHTGYTFTGWSSNGSAVAKIYDNKEYTGTQASSASGYLDFKQYSVNAPFASGDVYQLDVDVKGSGTLYNYFYGSSNYLQVANWKSSTSGKNGTNTDGCNTIPLTNSYAHYTVTFTLGSSGNGNVVKYILFRAMPGCTASIKNVKLHKISANSPVYMDGQTVTNLTATNGGTVKLYATWVDVTAPTTTAPTATTKTNSITVTNRQTDNGSGIASIQYQIKKNGTATWGALQSGATFNGLTQNTKYDVRTHAVDKAGNASDSAVTTVTTGTIPGLTTGSNLTFTPTPSGWTNGNVSVKVSTTVTGYTLQTSTDGKAWSTTNPLTYSANGTAYARLWDGNNASAVATTNITNIDKLAPTNTAPTVATTTNKITITNKQVDQNAGNGSGKSDLNASKTQYRLVTNTSGTTAVTGKDWQSSNVFSGLTQNTTYYVQTKVTDNAGNTTTSAVTTAKTTSIPTPTTGSNLTFTPSTSSWTNGNVSVAVSTTVKGYTLQTSTDGKTWSTTNPLIYSANGTAYARLWDGNNASAVATTNITNIDKLAPTNTAPTVATTTNKITATLKQVDQNAGSGSGKSDLNASKTQYRLVTNTSGTTAVTGKDWQSSNVFSGLTQNTTYYVQTKVTDNAGNTTTSAVATAKTTTVPSGTTSGVITLTPDHNTWTNTDVKVTATTNQTGYTIQMSTDGKTFTDGTSKTLTSNGTVYARLRDSSNNYGASASISISIIDKVAPKVDLVEEPTNYINSQAKIKVTTDVENKYTKGYYAPWSNNGGAVEDVSSTESGPITSSKTWKFTKTGTGNQWNGWEGTYNGIFSVNSGDRIMLSGYYKTSANAGITSLSAGAVYNSDWSKRYNTTTEDSKLNIVADGKWNYFYIIMKANESFSNGIVCDGPSWNYSTKAGTLYINGLNWRIIPSSNTTAKDIHFMKYATGSQNSSYFESGNGTYLDGNEFTITNNGTYTVWAKDIAGNTTIKTINITNFDKEPPTTTAPTVTNTTNRITVTNKQTDALSGIASIQYQIKKNSDSAWGTLQSGATFNGLTQNTKYDVRTHAVDKAGNASDSAVTTVTTGTIPGLTTGSNLTFTPTPSGWTNGNVSVKVSTTVTGYTLQTSIDGKTWGATNPLTYSANGTAYARLWDGNNASAVATTSITNIDKTAPSFNAKVSNVSSSGYDVIITGVSDTQSGVNRIQCPTWTESNGQDDLDGAWSTSDKSKATKQADGSYKFRVNITDHKNENGKYITHVYGYDNVGNNKTIVLSATVPAVTITWNANGGTAVNATSGKAGNAIGTLPTTTRTGYTFAGWFTAASGGTQITTTSTYPTSGNVTYYAHWTTNKYYYDVNPNAGIASFDITYGGTTETKLTDFYRQLNYGTQVVIKNVVAKPGYTYTGYSISGTLIKDNSSTNQNIITRLGAGNGAIALIGEDKTAPTTTAPTATTKTNSITVTNKQTDALSGIASIQYQIKKNSDSAWGTLQSGATFNGLTQNTKYDVRTHAVDRAGNASDSAVTTVTTGTIPTPTAGSNLTFTPTPSGWTNGNVSVKVSTTVTGYTLQTSIDGKTWGATNPLTYSANGTAYARLWDGNNASAVATTSITNIDKTAPTISISGKAGDISVKINTTTSDTQAGVNSSSLKYKIDNGTWQTSNVFDNLDPDKTYTFVAQVTDNAGNTKESNKISVKPLGGVFAKLYDTDSDGTGDTLTFGNKSNFAYNGTLKKDYGNIKKNHQLRMPWNDSSKIITKVEFVTEVKPHYTANWFYIFEKLNTIKSIKNLNTSNVTDMNRMFYKCSSLTSLDVSNFNTSNVTNMSYMFGSCSSLTSLNLSNFNTSKVTNMRCMFYDCKGLKNLDVSNFDTSKVTGMSNMFYNCRGLTSLNVSNFNTSNVTNMSFMFENNSGLTSLKVSNFNTSKVTDMTCMFGGCTKLTSLDVSNFNTSNVTDMYSMFAGCGKLTSLDVSNFNTSNVTNMSNMFEDCSSLTSLNVSNFNTSKVTGMSSMFYDCSGLTSLNLSNFNTSKVTDMHYMFDFCYSLTTIYVDSNKWSTTNVTKSDNMFYNCSKLKGQKGTVYSSSHVDASYAKVDGGTSNPGYLTQK